MSETNLDRISTRWSEIHDVEHFLVRYSASVRRYLEAMLGPGPDADDVCQEFFLRVVKTGFVRASAHRGRFRDYLKTSVRNAALSHLRKKQTEARTTGDHFLEDTIPDISESDVDRAWLADWRNVLLGRAWQELESHQQRSPGNLFHTVLRLSVDHADEDSTALGGRASKLAGRPLRADAYRKQLSGARRLFAQLLVSELAETLQDPTPENLEEELVETGLSLHVMPFLPADWLQSLKTELTRHRT